jgi:Zn finger protein HypA/HybF involved in hydrogenase expression
VHDFLLAKRINDEILKIAQEKNLKQIESVSLEIGSVSLSHDGLPEHVDDVSLESLNFGLEALAKGTILEGAKWKVEKIAGDNWKIKDISGK